MQGCTHQGAFSLYAHTLPLPSPSNTAPSRSPLLAELPYVKLPPLRGARGIGPKGAGQAAGRRTEEAQGWWCLFWVLGRWGEAGLGLVGVYDFSWSASMREQGPAGAAGAQGREKMALKLLFWELEKHLKR